MWVLPTQDMVYNLLLWRINNLYQCRIISLMIDISRSEQREYFWESYLKGLLLIKLIMKKPIPGPVLYRLLVQWFELVFCIITKRQDQIDIHSDSISAKKNNVITNCSQLFRYLRFRDYSMKNSLLNFCILKILLVLFLSKSTLTSFRVWPRINIMLIITFIC